VGTTNVTTNDSPNFVGGVVGGVVEGESLFSDGGSVTMSEMGSEFDIDDRSNTAAEERTILMRGKGQQGKKLNERVNEQMSEKVNVPLDVRLDEIQNEVDNNNLHLRDNLPPKESSWEKFNNVSNNHMGTINKGKKDGIKLNEKERRKDEDLLVPLSTSEESGMQFKNQGVSTLSSTKNGTAPAKNKKIKPPSKLGKDMTIEEKITAALARGDTSAGESSEMDTQSLTAGSATDDWDDDDLSELME